MSGHVRSVSLEPLNQFFFFFFTKLGMVVNYPEAMCHAEKLVHCRECQGHSEPECPIEKWDYCVQGQGHSEGSKCQ